MLSDELLAAEAKNEPSETGKQVPTLKDIQNEIVEENLDGLWNVYVINSEDSLEEVDTPLCVDVISGPPLSGSAEDERNSGGKSVYKVDTIAWLESHEVRGKYARELLCG